MSLLRKKGWWQIVLHSRLTLLVLLVASITISFAVHDRYVIEREMAERRQVKEMQLYAMEEQRDELKERVEYLKGEQGIESEIRKYFDVALEGEKVVVLIGESEEEATDTPTNKVIVEEKSWWQRLLPWLD